MCGDKYSRPEYEVTYQFRSLGCRLVRPINVFSHVFWGSGPHIIDDNNRQVVIGALGSWSKCRQDVHWFPTSLNQCAAQQRWPKMALGTRQRASARPPRSPKMSGRTSLGRNSVVIRSRSARAKLPVGFGSTDSISNSALMPTNGGEFAGFASSKRNSHLIAQLLWAPRTRRIIFFSSTTYGIRPASASLPRKLRTTPPRRISPTSSS